MQGIRNIFQISRYGINIMDKTLKFLHTIKKKYGKTMRLSKHTDYDSLSPCEIKISIDKLMSHFDTFWIEVPRMTIYIPKEQKRTAIIASESIVKKDSACKSIEHLLSFEKFAYQTVVRADRGTHQIKIRSGKFTDRTAKSIDAICAMYPDSKIKIEIRRKMIVIHVISAISDFY